MTSNKAILYLSLGGFVICSIWGLVLFGIHLGIAGARLLTVKSSPVLLFSYLCAVAISVHVVLYFCSRAFLGRKLADWGMSLVQNGKAVGLKGKEYIFLYLGFAWRTFVLMYVTSAVVEKLKDAMHIPPAHPSYILEWSARFLMLYLSVFWVIKGPGGSVKLLFQKEKAEG